MEEVIHSLDGFEQVWERVSGKAPCADGQAVPQNDEAQMLCQRIEAAAAAAAGYELLMRRCGALASKLSPLRAQEREHVRSMQLEYFLLTGESCPCSTRAALPTGQLAALRSLYLAVQERQRAYQQAERSTRQEPLRTLYASLADSAGEHAAVLRRLIGASM